MLRHDGQLPSAIGITRMPQIGHLTIVIRGIRRKLGESADLVQAVRGVGYRFRDPNATEEDASESEVP